MFKSFQLYILYYDLKYDSQTEDSIIHYESFLKDELNAFYSA